MGKRDDKPDAEIERAMLQEVRRDDAQERGQNNNNDDSAFQAAQHDAGDTIHITEADAVSLIQQGFEFTASSDVTVHAQGTDLSTDLDDLDDLGIDHVEADPDTFDGSPDDQGDILLSLGLNTIETSADPMADLLTVLESFDEPIFRDEADVGLRVTEAESEAFADASNQLQRDIVQQLVDLGVDYVQVIGTEEPEDDGQA